MNLAVEFTKLFLWTIFRFDFVLIRNFVWFFKGIGTQLRLARRSSSYKKTAHVRKIISRFCFDYIIEPSSEMQFLTVHDSFQDPEYVLQDHVTLFTIDEKEAVFVESDRNKDALDSDHGPFLRIAQFQLAKKIIILPIHAFHQLAEKLPDPSDKIIFANNCARCGSTLLTQVFELSGKVLAMSEPDALNALTRLSKDSPNRDRIIVNSIKALCKPVRRDVQAYILKPTQPSMIATPTLHRLYPDAKFLYMYREGLPVIKSLDKIAHAMPIFQSALLFGSYSRTFTILFVKMAGLSPEAIGHKVKSRSHFASVLWGSAMRMYLDFLDNGIPIKAIKYEDMIEDTHYAFKQIFDYVGIEFDANAVDKAFSRDSQRGSPINMEALKKFGLEEITPEIQGYIDETCDFFKIPRIPTKVVVPGTITKKPSTGAKPSNGIHDAGNDTKRTSGSGSAFTAEEDKKEA